MLFAVSSFKSKLAVFAASLIFAASLAASPASAGEKLPRWLKGEGARAGERGSPRVKGARERGRERSTRERSTRERSTRERSSMARMTIPIIPPREKRGKQGRRGEREAVAPYRGRQGKQERRERYVAPAPGARTPRDPGRTYRRGDGTYQHDDGGRRYAGRRRGHSGGYSAPAPRYRRTYTYNRTYNYYRPRHYSRSYYTHYYYPLYFPYVVARPVYYPVYVPYHVHQTYIQDMHGHNDGQAYCQDTGYASAGAPGGGGSHVVGGTLVGGLLGAAAGSQFGKGDGKLVAVGVGALVGALIGADIGHSMDQADQVYATNAANQALESTQACNTIIWNNPRTGNSGAITPTYTYEPTPGRYCREFQQQVVIGGQTQDAYGTACRQPDGSWEVVAEQP